MKQTAFSKPHHKINSVVHHCILALFIVLFLFLSQIAFGDETDMINHPVNTNGLTGLLFTTQPYTLQTGSVEIGVAVLSENSTIPDYTITEYPIVITTGLSPKSELALRGSFSSIKEGPTLTAQTARQAGNVELSYKRTLLVQQEDSLLPAVSFFSTGIVPIEQYSNVRINSATYWGVRAGISIGTEFYVKNQILGIYADGQLAGDDLSEKRLRDVYELFNAGILFPISKENNLQMFLEYSMVHGMNVTTLTGGDYYGVTYGFRMVSERLNLTVGTQFLDKQNEGYNNSNRIIAMTSLKF